MNETDLLAAISRQWGMTFIRLRPNLPLTGSPERTSWRCVVETDTGQLFVLEKIPSRTYGRKLRIIATLQKLLDRGLAQVAAYRTDTDGDAIALIDHGLWQVCPFVSGIDLDRPAYTQDGWRGDAAAEFLVRLHGICSKSAVVSDTPPFSISDYTRTLFATLSQQRPEWFGTYRPFSGPPGSNPFRRPRPSPHRLLPR